MSAIQQLLTDHIGIWTAADAAKRTGRGRASGNAGSVYGVKKLRELILELAVRGKLVPQDANDEPASELLKRIQKEKDKLIAAGKIKKDKPLAEITEEEKPFELPAGWAYSNLGDVVEIVRGITFPGSEKSKSPEKGRIACLRTSNVQDQIEWDDILYIREEFVSREDQILKPLDIVMSMANSRELVGKVALVGEKINQRTSFGGFLGVLRPFLIEPRFVMALLRTPHTREMLIDSASQTTNIANVSLAKLRPLFFAIPPLAEQHRIVAKVDELMALCDQLEAQHNLAAEAHEKIVSVLLQALTQSADASAFADNWQRIAAHFDTLFTTEVSIDALKQTLLQLAVVGFFTSKPVFSDQYTTAFSHLLANSDGSLRRGPFGSSIRKDMFVRDGYKVYEQKNAIGNDCSLGEYFIPGKKFKELEGFSVVPGDFIVSCAGTIGKISLLPEHAKSGVINQALMRIRTNKKVIDDRFFIVLFQSPYFQSAIMETTKGSAMKNLAAVKTIKAIKLWLPSIDEQHRIVAKVDELMALCDQLKARIGEAGRLQQKIADVVVANAT